MGFVNEGLVQPSGAVGAWFYPAAPFIVRIRNRATDPRCTKVLERMDRMVRERAAQHDFSKICLRKDGSWKTARPRQMPADPDAFLLYQDPPKATPKLPAPYELEYPGKNVLGL